MKESLIYGTLLGDAWIYKYFRKNKHKEPTEIFSFRFSQSNKEYALWKAELLGLKFNSYKIVRFDARTKKYYENLTIELYPDKAYLKQLYSIFYNPKKIISLEILDKLDASGILLWYLDDGNMYYNGKIYQVTLSVNCFTDIERALIIKWFKDKHDLNFKLAQKAIRLTSKKECFKFMKIVENKIPDCMKYKSLNYKIENYKNKVHV